MREDFLPGIGVRESVKSGAQKFGQGFMSNRNYGCEMFA
jgi:hypothetical protein